MFRFKDDLGYWWVWDGERIYMEEAEEEMVAEGETNGYFASTLEKAIEILVDVAAISTIEIVED